MVEFQEVTKNYGAKSALDDVSFAVEEGEFVFITGPSGAGKTTILRLLLREIKPDKGKVLIEGRDISSLRRAEIPYYRRKLGFVFQDFKLLYDRTVWENVALALEIRGNLENHQDRIQEALDEVEMQEGAKLFPRQLAGGEAQRVVIARALVTDPKIILADEPTGNLDPATSRQIVSLLDKVAKKGTTILMATHNENIVNLLKRRVLTFREGKLISDKKGGKYE